MVAHIITAVLALMFLATGLPKVLGVGKAVEQVTRFHYSAGFARLVGIGEMIAAASLGWGLHDPRGVLIGCVLVIVIMSGALYSHLVRARDPVGKWGPAAAILILAGVLLGMTL